MGDTLNPPLTDATPNDRPEGGTPPAAAQNPQSQNSRHSYTAGADTGFRPGKEQFTAEESAAAVAEVRRVAKAAGPDTRILAISDAGFANAATGKHILQQLEAAREETVERRHEPVQTVEQGEHQAGQQNVNPGMARPMKSTSRPANKPGGNTRPANNQAAKRPGFIANILNRGKNPQPPKSPTKGPVR